ncbi:MAG: hypothetical protein US28_C0043G0017 [Candidatus Daviesbacteria bacterium GW2011_GWA1_36_8]|uniref:YdbS-like PH domain-containing protein n=1 Tax=Candidatus Daviesbacteria bacterium GW2011_GWA1_36_8 TaxID=1618417 RepID=A0A0G0ICR6_9BACT|nr:MAG: hypothetical protein US28_C0043G0017 [Candidatus Daviesbacteria bacterium GW2011_GWA1_36_8]
MQFKFFPAFFKSPPKIKFIEQEPDEQIILFLRQHGITNVPWILLALFAIFLPFIVIQLDISLGTNFLINVPNQALIGGLVIYYMLIIAYIIEQFLFWYFNIYIVTNLHLVDINFHSLLSRDIIELEFRDVESVSTDIRGIFASLFNFGDVIVQTAGTSANIQFLKVPKSQDVVTIINHFSE